MKIDTRLKAEVCLQQRTLSDGIRDQRPWLYLSPSLYMDNSLEAPGMHMRNLCDHIAGTLSSVQFNCDVASGTSKSFLVNNGRVWVLSHLLQGLQSRIQPTPFLLGKQRRGFLPENGHGVEGRVPEA